MYSSTREKQAKFMSITHSGQINQLCDTLGLRPEKLSSIKHE